MSADLYIHAMSGVTEEDLECFFSSSFGSRWENRSQACTRPPRCAHRQAVSDSPSVWIGEVSWLKAALLEDSGYVPEPVEAVTKMIGEHLPVLDEDLRAGLLRAIAVHNQRAANYRVVRDESVVGWFDKHMGARLFTVSW
ncbi:hypothetical protein [Spongiactinospora sp. TRM90649]|uniref:hypothetical protein n=1 Tax=Spongiactinospora sp. TRM90649 TaxID=3031114 RepID=UPI0023F8657D|nr:hypothetical protein [Spongiactinospora sp. TRM90649]MDF5756594.1 hypothetical protein [Spongiactinospora sp. TRM90649]